MNMSPQTWRKVSELLEIALDLSGDERDEWIRDLPARLSPDEQDVLAPLKNLLAQQPRLETSDVLRASPDIQGALLADRRSNNDTSSELRPGAVVGAYRLIRELGRGGMGAVWLAEQVDGRLQRTVALKLPFAGPQQRHIAKRFLLERDILAKLEHPNIARLYDADAANPDRPFLVLEYVDGVPIDEYCRSRELPLRERLQLFRQVFGALQYAHTHLVIHRDLKPSNILVTPEGVVRLLDFGIAKVLKEDNESNTVMTEVGSVVMTPNFASPEQVIGAELTTASDVYALGVVLYQLLTDARPYEIKQEGRRALEDAIVAADIIKPSEAARGISSDSRAKQTAKELQGDLDTILLKALKKRPAERYPTVAAFADDVERYLAGEMVLAQADTALYRLRKFAGRNRLAVGAAAAVVAALGVGLVVSLWQLQVARAERRHAEEVKEFMASIFRSASPFVAGTETMTAAALLSIARERIDRELVSQPRTAVEMLMIVGESQGNLDQRDASKAALRKAIELGERLEPRDEVLLAKARSLLVVIMAFNGEREQSRLLAAEVLPALRKYQPETSISLTDVLMAMGRVESADGNYDLAIAHCQEAVAISIAARGSSSEEAVTKRYHLGIVLVEAQRFKEAQPVAEQVLHGARALAKPGERGALLLQGEELYGKVLVEVGEYQAAIPILNSAIELSFHINGAKNNWTYTILYDLARAQQQLGDYKSFVATRRRTYESVTHDLLKARTLTNLARATLIAYRVPDALELFPDAIKLTRQYDTSPRSWLSLAQSDYGAALALSGRFDEADRLLEETLPLSRKSIAVGSVASTLNAIGLSRQLRSLWAESESAFREALENTDAAVPTARHRGQALQGIGIARLELGQAADAENWLRQADDSQRKHFLGMTPLRAEIAMNLGRALLAQGKIAAASESFATANAYWLDYDASNRCAGLAAYWVARGNLTAGSSGKAREQFDRAIAILQGSRLPGDARLLKDSRLQVARL